MPSILQLYVFTGNLESGAMSKEIDDKRKARTSAKISKGRGSACI
jgi:hypothetical protein